MTKGEIRAYTAEAIAVFTLVFVGCGAIIANALTNGIVGHVGIGLAFGLAILTMVYAVGHISGAHINPAVTLGFALTRHFPWWRVPFYWAAQLVGALAAALVLRWFFGNVAHLGTALPSGSDGQSFGMEVVLTFFLMFVIMSVATDNRAVGEAAALAIGFTILMDAMVGGQISGASMNPARSLGPAIVSGTFAHQWLYILGPFLGSVLGAFAYEFVRGEKPRPGETTPGK